MTDALLALFGGYIGMGLFGLGLWLWDRRR